MNSGNDISRGAGANPLSVEPAARHGGGNAFLAAVTLLTRLPVGRARHAEMRLERAVAYFPLVGAAVGVLTAGTLAVAGQLLPLLPAVLLAMLVEVLATGALHEDGLADCCDGLGGGWTRDDMLRIMKDSHTGVYGALGLCFTFGLKASALLALIELIGAPRWWVWGSAIIAAATLSRMAIVVTLITVPAVAGRESLTNGFAVERPGPALLVGALWTTGAVLPYSRVLPISFAVSLLLGGAGVVGLQALFRARLGGITGDCLGCVACVTQILCLLGACVRATP